MSIFLGVVQGVAEFLPISSSGHLAIFQNFFGIENVENSHMFFSVLLHLGTLFAVFVVYRKDIKEMIVEFFSFFKEIKDPASDGIKQTKKRRQLLLIVIATLPLILGLLVNDLVEQMMASSLAIGVALIITGCILYLADRHMKGTKTEKNASVWDALIVGIAQLFGIVPGISRSGITISAGLFCGFDREFAVRFSFLLSIPAILGANILSLVDSVRAGIDTSLMPVYLVGVVVAAVVGYFAIKLVQKIVDNKKFGGFAWYCWGVGALVVILSFFIG